MPYSHIQSLLIDIDDTIVRFKKGMSSHSFFDVLHTAGVELGGLSGDEASKRIARVKEMRWWHWSDFIVALDLNPKRFWRYALEVEKVYLEPTGSEICPALRRLKAAGILLYVTSNNPSSGILHKLSLAGVANIQGTTLFHQLLGATELNAMKSEPIYWEKALAHAGLDASEVATVGDNPHDDQEIPQSVGIRHTFLINRDEDRSLFDSDVVTHVTSFDQIANLIINARSGALKPPGIANKLISPRQGARPLQTR